MNHTVDLPVKKYPQPVVDSLNISKQESVGETVDRIIESYIDAWKRLAKL